MQNICKKIRHKTTYGAAELITHLKNKGKLNNKKMGIYWCNKCDAYHITSNIKIGCIVKTK